MASGVLEWLLRHEPLWQALQRLMIWDNPRRSGALVVAFHLALWVLSLLQLRTVCLLSVLLLLVLVLDAFKEDLGRVLVDEPTSNTAVWSAQETIEACDKVRLRLSAVVQQALLLRERRPFGFCFVSSSVCVLIALFGRLIPVVLLVYLLVMNLMLVPALLHHNIGSHVVQKVLPALQLLEHSMEYERRSLPQQMPSLHEEEEDEEVVEVDEDLPSVPQSSDSDEDLVPYDARGVSLEPESDEEESVLLSSQQRPLQARRRRMEEEYVFIEGAVTSKKAQ